jgi:radical SAM family uncharacterized protein
MAVKSDRSRHRMAASEIGTIKKSWRGKIRIALVYPNRYALAMSNLGFQTLYHLFNSFEHVVCERGFLPEDDQPGKSPLKTFESEKALTDADIIAFSLSFENDHPHVLSILEHAGLALRSCDRSSRDPLVIAGGVVCFLNPEPLAAFIDCFLIGEAEAILPRFLEVFESQKGKASRLKAIAQNVPGAYIPALYRPEYNRDGTLAAFTPLEDVPPKIERVFLKDLSRVSTHSVILTPETIFERTFLIEVGRGCPHGCRFCSAGFIYRPPRFRPLALLAGNIRKGVALTETIGLVGAAVTDLPGLAELCTRFRDKNIRIAFSSLRADRLAPEILTALQQSNVKTATIAPEAGTQRLRDVINKGITEEAVLNAAAALVEHGIPNLKLYFMIGLPTETEADVDGIIALCKGIKHRFLKSSRTRKRIGEITVSLNSFVPKPFTPFQWVAMDDVVALKRKIKKIRQGLKRVANVRVHADIPRWAYIQAILSRGDRRVAEILTLAHQNRGNWSQTLKSVPVNPDFYVGRRRDENERLPWDFIDHGIKKSFLWREYQKAMQGLTTPACRVKTCTRCGVCNDRKDGPVNLSVTCSPKR